MGVSLEWPSNCSCGSLFNKLVAVGVSLEWNRPKKLLSGPVHVSMPPDVCFIGRV